jgi:hypothetical protein
LGPKEENIRNLFLCLVGTYVLLLIGSMAILTYVLPVLPTPLIRNLNRGTLALELSVILTFVISAIAIPLGFAFMYFFGGVISTKVIRIYLFITRGKHIVLPKNSAAAPNGKRPKVHLKLDRQLIYFLFIFAVVVSFASYLANHREPLVAPIGQTRDIATLLTGDFVTLTMSASLIVPLVALALPYFRGLRLRSIDVGPFHTTVLSTIIGVSGGFTLLYTLLTKPILEYVLFYAFLLLGICWSFATGCNLGAEAANSLIVDEIYSAKANSRLLSSRIWLENPPGKLVEI